MYHIFPPRLLSPLLSACSNNCCFIGTNKWYLSYVIINNGLPIHKVKELKLIDTFIGNVYVLTLFYAESCYVKVKLTRLINPRSDFVNYTGFFRHFRQL